MVPSLDQLPLLSREDRIIYRKWLRRSVIFYSTAVALLVVAIAANHIFTSVSPDTVLTAAISARK
jgi:hypothetical protein